MADTNTEPTVVSPNAAMAKPEGLATENDQVDSAGEQDRIRDNTAGSQPGRGVQPQPTGPQKLDLQPADAQDQGYPSWQTRWPPSCGNTHLRLPVGRVCDLQG